MKLLSENIRDITLITTLVLGLTERLLHCLIDLRFIGDLHLLLNTLFTAFREAFIFTNRHVQYLTLERLYAVYGCESTCNVQRQHRVANIFSRLVSSFSR